MTGEPTNPRQSRSLWKRAILWIVGAVSVALLALVAVHVMIQPVAPEQDTPAGHFGRPCVLCHIVAEGTDVIDTGD